MNELIDGLVHMVEVVAASEPAERETRWWRVLLYIVLAIGVISFAIWVLAS